MVLDVTSYHRIGQTNLILVFSTKKWQKDILRKFIELILSCPIFCSEARLKYFWSKYTKASLTWKSPKPDHQMIQWKSNVFFFLTRHFFLSIKYFESYKNLERFPSFQKSLVGWKTWYHIQVSLKNLKRLFFVHCRNAKLSCHFSPLFF